MNESVLEWRRIFERQHDQINTRANMFIVINALLMAGVTASNICGLQIMLSIIGLVSCVLWLYLSSYSKKRYDFFHKKLLEYEMGINEQDRVYTIIKNDAPKASHELMSSTNFLCFILPFVLFVLWIVTLVII